MKISSPEFVDSLKQDYVHKPLARAFAEWNYNRFATVQEVSSSVGDQFTQFPVASIVDAPRPRRAGVVRVFPNQSTIYSQYTSGQQVRSYLTSDDSKYKYWVSAKSASAPVSGAYPLNNTVTVLYGHLVRSNKIVLQLEDSFTSMVAGTLQVTADGVTWTTVANPVTENGRVELYLQPNNTWSDTPNRTVTTMLRGVRLNINSLNEADSRLGVIELNLSISADLTPYLINFTVSEEISDYSFISPLGAASANVSTLSLFNVDGMFNNDNPLSPYYGIIDKAVDFKVETGLEIGGVVEWITLANMHSAEKWSGQTSDEVSVSLVDDSDWMQTVKPPKVFFKNRTPSQIIQILCDLCGFNVVELDTNSFDASSRVPYFWTSGEETLWDVISDLSQQTQTAAFFNESGMLNVVSRTNISSGPVAWDFVADRTNTRVPDISEYEDIREVEANAVDVNFSETSVSKFNNGLPKMEVVWEGQEGLTLRASPLKVPLTASAMTFTVNAEDAKTWPYEGNVVINDEVISYKGLEYLFYNLAGVATYRTVYSKEEKDAIDANESNDLQKYKNGPTGKFYITERAARGTVAQVHPSTMKPHQSLVVYRNSNATNTLAPATVKDSVMNITYPKSSHLGPMAQYIKAYTVSFQGINKGAGTRLRFNGGYTNSTNGEAGVFIGNNESMKGYYVSVFPTAFTNPAKNFPEIHLWTKRADQARVTVAMAPFEILFDKWYDIDVILNVSGSVDTVTVFINGVFVCSGSFTGIAKIAHTDQRRAGVHVGRWSSNDFEYFYHYGGARTVNPAEFSYFDYKEKENRTTYSPGQPYKKDPFRGADAVLYDDFGSVARELRDFEVKFDNENPTAHSNIYLTNTLAGVLSYRGNPFGADFTLVNQGRRNEILVGEDLQTFGADNSVNQSAIIYGRVVERAEQKTKDAKNEESVRRRGEVRTDFSSDWIQTDAAATALSEWVVNQIGLGAKVSEVVTWMNPLLQVGDIVTIDYPSKNITPASKFVIVKVNHAWESGLTTSVSLMQVV